MPEPNTKLVAVPNVLRKNKLSELCDEVCKHLNENNVVLITNSKEHTDACVQLVEAVKQVYPHKLFQTNRLESDPVYIDQAESDLSKPRIHHYKLTLNIKLSLTPLELTKNESQQLSK